MNGTGKKAVACGDPLANRPSNLDALTVRLRETRAQRLRDPADVLCPGSWRTLRIMKIPEYEI